VFTRACERRSTINFLLSYHLRPYRVPSMDRDFWFQQQTTYRPSCGKSFRIPRFNLPRRLTEAWDGKNSFTTVCNISGVIPRALTVN
jgi:hypothetical protein